MQKFGILVNRPDVNYFYDCDKDLELAARMEEKLLNIYNFQEVEFQTDTKKVEQLEKRGCKVVWIFTRN